MRKVAWLKVLTHVVSLLPLVALLWAVWQRQLGPDWIGAATRRAGRYALLWLLLALLPTAVRVLSGWPGLLRVRRILGLYALLYALVHLAIFLGLNYALNLGLAWQAVRDSPFILAGAAALVLLIPLGLTSTAGGIRRLGRYWQPLHRLAYPAAALAVLHYAWKYKELRRTPLLAAGVLAFLLVLRLPPLASGLARWRTGFRARQS